MSLSWGRPPPLAATTSPTTVLGDLSRDVTLTSPPEDSISALSWSPTANHLAVASWDKKVRIYDVTKNPSGEGKAIIDFEGPVLSCHWSKDGQKIIGAGADNTARVLDLASNGAPALQVAGHDAPIKSVRFFTTSRANAAMIATGSWDKTVKYWDLRQPTSVASLTCKERVYSMDIKRDLLAIGTAERHINLVNLQNPTSFFKSIESPLKHQTRVVSCFTDADGIVIGGIEGRCSIVYRYPSDHDKNFSFKCHREVLVNNNTDVYSVNDISFHPNGTFSSAGSDGTFHYWDKEAKHRLRPFPNVGGSISATGFNKDGELFAYAVSYDWSKGYAHNQPKYPNKVILHTTTGDEVQPKHHKKK